MSEAIVHGRDGLLPRTNALEPVGHVLDGHTTQSGTTVPFTNGSATNTIS